MDAKMVEYGIGIAISYYVIKEMFVLVKMYIKKNNQTDGFVNKEDCKFFKTRIGKESDSHRKNIEGLRGDISEIKEGVAYLKGKWGN